MGAQREPQQIIVHTKLANGCTNALMWYWLDFEMVVQTCFSTEEYQLFDLLSSSQGIIF